MSKATSGFEPQIHVGTRLPGRSAPCIPVMPLGMGLGSFFALTFVLCVLFDLWFPDLAMNPVWAPLLPGFSWISWSSFLLGFVEAFAYGWYIALVFAPIFNFFSMRSGVDARP